MSPTPTSPEPVEGRAAHPPTSPEPVEGRAAAAKPSLRGPLLRFALLVALVAGGFLLLRWGPVAERLDPEVLTAAFRRIAAQPWAPLALLAAYLVLCPLGVPVSPLILAGGLVFGFAWGAALNIAGCWGGAAVTYLLGRLLGKDFVEHLLGDRLRRIERMVERHAFWTLVRLRFVPIPYALVNYAAALAGVRPAVFLSATALGLAPAVAIFTWFAAALSDLATTQTGDALPVFLKLAAAFVLLFALTFLPRWLGRGSPGGTS
jgi:phospholipase D1/2